MIFSSTAGNPDGRVNYDRTFMSALGSQETRSDGLSFFVQDQFTYNRLTFNVGLRGEQWKHFASTGEDIFTFDWAVAPRLSAAYDLRGDGKQKVYGYYGRYYDPIRNNMTNFAGTLSGFVREEQVFINNDWVTYRTRGGLVQQDAFFAPSTKTPYTDDITAGYQVDLGRNMSLEAAYTNRRTRDILEDYDLALFATSTSGATDYPGPINDPQSLWLGLDYFGYTENPGSNFVIATLNGGKRNYQGVDLIFRKRYSDRWQLLGSYTYNWAKGNTNSDSNADFQGDVLWLDPLAPDTYKKQPGTIPHVFKVAGSYIWPIGIELGAAFRSNSGTIASRTALNSQRNLPIQVSTPFAFAGITSEQWVTADAIGSLQNPAWAQLDLRAQYKRPIAGHRHRVLRGHLQRPEQPGLDPRSGSRGRRGRDGVRGADSLPRSTALLPRGAGDVLSRARRSASRSGSRISIGRRGGQGLLSFSAPLKAASRPPSLPKRPSAERRPPTADRRPRPPSAERRTRSCIARLFPLRCSSNEPNRHAGRVRATGAAGNRPAECGRLRLDDPPRNRAAHGTVDCDRRPVHRARSPGTQGVRQLPAVGSDAATRRAGQAILPAAASRCIGARAVA